MKLRFPTSIILYFIPISILLYSCDEQETTENENFQQNLNTFNNTMNKLDSTLNLMDSLQRTVDIVEEDRALGKITDEEAIEKLDQINNTLGRQIAITSNFHPVEGLPTWAKQLGLTAPTGMKLDKDYSQSTSEKNDNEGFNSITLIYRGKYNVAIQQAEIIANRANIPMSQDYKDALILSEKYNIESIKGAAYMNFDFGSDNNPRYNISITVDDYGTLTINATDSYALMQQLNER
jgi:predicted RND superfamily exporter protein